VVTAPRDVDAVLCNFNQARWLPLCLGHLARQTTPIRRLHVVDNASTDDSVAIVERCARELSLNVTIHRLETNTGGAGGFAYGTARAVEGRPAFVLLLDSDAFVHEQAVERLVARACEQPNVGVLGPKVYLAPPDARDSAAIAASRVVQEVGGNIDPQQADFVLRHRHHDESASGVLTGTAAVDYVAACTCLARTDAILRCGTMDPSFFIYWDDIDWCDRIRGAGYQVEACADAISWHVGGGRVRTSLVPTYYSWRNRVRYFGERSRQGNDDGLHAALFQGLRAVFTCRVFGQSATAALIERAIEDGWADRRGATDFSNACTAIEHPRSLAPQRDQAAGFSWIDGRPHVLDVPEATDHIDDERTVVADRFGKTLILREARAARAEFDRWYPARVASLMATGGAWS
jgi:GT2 family glycosyltransferase